MKRVFLGFVAALPLLALLARSETATSRDAAAQARRHLATATYLEGKGQLEEAVREYELSLSFVPDTGIAAKLADARRRLSPGSPPPAPVAAHSPAPEAPASRRASQEKRAGEWWAELVGGGWDTAQAEAVCHRIASQCPESSLAPEALWRLSALARMHGEGPDEREVAECMDELILRYPDSPLAPAARLRRLEARVALGQWDLASASHAEVLAGADHEDPAVRAGLWLGWARVQFALSRGGQALECLERAGRCAEEDPDRLLVFRVAEERGRILPAAAGQVHPGSLPAAGE